MLFKYMQDTQRFLREQKQDFENPDDLIAHINRARREIAMRTQCIRVLTPSSGRIIGYSITSGGTGYSDTPTVTVTTPDFPSGVRPNPNGLQATALAIVQQGVIIDVANQNGGDGYFQPVVTITDPTGIGAVVTPIVGGINLLQQGQEVYPFSGIDLSANPGCASVYFVRSVSIIYSNYRYSLPMYAFSVYQSTIRQYPFQYEYVPSMSSQFGQGVDGSLYLYPIASQQYQWEADCQCIPIDLQDDQAVEAIPMPWQDAVAFYATHLVMASLQNYNAAEYWFNKYEKFAVAYSNYARAGRITNPYGRYVWALGFIPAALEFLRYIGGGGFA